MVQIYDDNSVLRLVVNGASQILAKALVSVRVYGNDVVIGYDGNEDYYRLAYTDVSVPTVTSAEDLRQKIGEYLFGIAANCLCTPNSTTTALDNGQTFTGEYRNVSKFNSVVTAVKTDTNAILYVDFSPDGINTDSTLTFNVAANVNEVHRIVVTRPYYRIRITNNSGSNQTYLRATALLGSQSALTSTLNSQIQADADTTVVRPLDFNLLVAENLYQNRQQFIKDGFNNDIDSLSVPEDINNEGGVYAGFPLGTPETGQIVVSGADTGTVVYAFMASIDDTDYTFASFDVTGAGTYTLPHNIYRCNFAFFINTTATRGTASNVGDITIRNTPTTTNVFCVIPAGYGQTFCSAYSVPAGSAVFIDRITGSVRGSTSGSMDGFFWYRGFNESPRLRFPFELQFGTLYFDDVDYLIRIPEKTDFCPRIIAASANNLQAKISYRIIKTIL